MPKDVLIVIERLTKLRDALQLKAEKIFNANFGRHTQQSLDLIDQWGRIKDRLQEIVDLNFGIDNNEKYRAQGDPDASHPRTLARIERDKVELMRKLKTVKRLENKGNELLSIPSPTREELMQEQEPMPKEEAPPKPQPKPKSKQKKKPASGAGAKKEEAPPPPREPIMPLEDYVKALDKLKFDAERAVVQQLPTLEQQAFNLVVEIVGGLNTKDGRLFANAETRSMINSFTDVYITAFTELQDYQGMISKYLKNFKPLAQLMQEFHAGRGVDPAKANVGAAQEVVIAEVIDRYTENGLNRGFVQPMRELLFNNVAGGLNKKQALAQLEDYIKSGKDQSGKLASYLEQTAQQGVDSYEGATNARIMQAYTIDTQIMAGSLIKTSSPQCKYCINKLGGLIDRSDWKDVVAIAEENGLIDGTTFDNLPFNKLHWGCRHSFTPAVLNQKERATFTKIKPLL